VTSNSSASLVDIGEGVVCLEFHSPHNSIGPDLIDMMDSSLDEVAANWEGLVIGNHGRNCCVGGNLGMLLQAIYERDWVRIETVVRGLQNACLKMQYSAKPVVAAPFRMTLGGGCEICLSASRVRAFTETYIGLTETAVGLVPSGGGCKEMLVRYTDAIPPSAPGAMGGAVQISLLPFVTLAFETIAMAKVSTSAADARKLGYLSPADKITFNQDFLLYDARETVLSMVKEGYQPPRPRDDIRVTGRTGFAVLEELIYTLEQGEFITEYDAFIGKKLAAILSGGNLPQNTQVTDRYILDLEVENFLSLCGEPRTQARIKTMLETGKPLRN
jgi:3-hydroxyacyl-CoA dehydrogenase